MWKKSDKKEVKKIELGFIEPLKTQTVNKENSERSRRREERESEKSADTPICKVNELVIA